MKQCQVCQTNIPDTYRKGLCLKCRKHKNYLSHQDKYVQSSKDRYAPIKSSKIQKHCNICNKTIGKSNTSNLCPTCFKNINKDIIRERGLASSKQWYANNGVQYYNNRYTNNIEHRLSKILRSRLNCAIKDNKGGSSIEDLGCSIEELKTHLESKFQEGMTWDNHTKDGWHIDHIIPLSSFDLTIPEELKKACHYTNLQPLWAKDNLSKGNKAPSN